MGKNISEMSIQEFLEVYHDEERALRNMGYDMYDKDKKRISDYAITLTTEHQAKREFLSQAAECLEYLTMGNRLFRLEDGSVKVAGIHTRERFADNIMDVTAGFNPQFVSLCYFERMDYENNFSVKDRLEGLNVRNFLLNNILKSDTIKGILEDKEKENGGKPYTMVRVKEGIDHVREDAKAYGIRLDAGIAEEMDKLLKRLIVEKDFSFNVLNPGEKLNLVSENTRYPIHEVNDNLLRFPAIVKIVENEKTIEEAKKADKAVYVSNDGYVKGSDEALTYAKADGLMEADGTNSVRADATNLDETTNDATKVGGNVKLNAGRDISTIEQETGKKETKRNDDYEIDQ